MGICDVPLCCSNAMICDGVVVVRSFDTRIDMLFMVIMSRIASRLACVNCELCVAIGIVLLILKNLNDKFSGSTNALW